MIDTMTKTPTELRQLASERLKTLCMCGHPMAKHAHGTAFCQHVGEGYKPCFCDKFVDPVTPAAAA